MSCQRICRVSDGRGPAILPKPPPIIPERVSDELYDKSIGMLKLGSSLAYKTRIIHMVDAVSRGTITPMEAYQALDADYFPIALETRESAYAYLLV